MLRRICMNLHAILRAFLAMRFIKVEVDFIRRLFQNLNKSSTFIESRVEAVIGGILRAAITRINIPHVTISHVDVYEVIIFNLQLTIDGDVRSNVL